MTHAYKRVDLGPIEQMHALRRLFGTDFSYSNEALAAISKLAVPQHVAAGTELATPDAIFESVYLIIDGLDELTYHNQRLGLFGSGTGVGALSALAQDQLGYGCRVVEDSTLLALRVSDLMEIFEDHFELMHGALMNVAADAIGWRRALLPNAGFSNQIRNACRECTEQSLGLVERMLYLRETIGLEDSYIDELAELARAATEVRYPAGTPLWSAGDVASYSMIVVKGEVQATSPEGATFLFGPGDILGNLDTIAGLPRWFDARVERDVIALTLDSEAIVDVWEDHPALGFAFLRMLSRLILSLRVQGANLQLPAATSASLST
jgi:CRP-like cAMP-binding protein